MWQINDFFPITKSIMIYLFILICLVSKTNIKKKKSPRVARNQGEENRRKPERQSRVNYVFWSFEQS